MKINEIIKSILGSAVDKLNRALSPRVRKLDQEIRELTMQTIQRSDTYQSILGGELAGHFGIEVGTNQARLDAILAVILSHLKVKFTKFALFGRENIGGGINIVLDKAVFDDLLNNHAGEITYVNKDGETCVLPWLEWLLIGGDRVAKYNRGGSDVSIVGYHILFKAAGRSGQAIMVPTGVWRVPAEHSGTKTNNWLTRSLSDTTDYIQNIGNLLDREIRAVI